MSSTKLHGTPQPPRPFQRSITAFLPDPLDFEDDSPGELIQVGQLCDICSPLRDWTMHRKTCTTALASCRKCSMGKERIWHHTTGAKLEESYRNGCHMCTQIWCCLLQDPDHEPGLLRTAGQVWLAPHKSLELHWANGKGPWPVFWNVHVQGRRGQWIGTGLQLNWHDGHRETTDSRSFARHDPGPWRSTRTASSFSWDLINSWIRQCVSSHPQCADSTDSVLPTRLLQVIRGTNMGEARYTIRLVDTATISNSNSQGGQMQYAALSYCWGSGTPFTLTKTSEPSLRIGVPANKLPRTIQHAVYTASKLGLSWLWVDSLCIVQDSPEDWTREADTMYDIYRGAFVTIAASGATDNTQGLFAQRDPLLYAPCWLDPSGHSRVPTLGAHSEDDAYWTRRKWPLNTRGWVLQETMLPPRTIQFGPFVSWQCRELAAHEFQRDRPTVYPTTQCGSFHEVITDSENVVPPNELTEIFWNETLVHYTEKSLSFPTDRLKAISGIIAGISRRMGWTNLNGLWEPFLLSEIQWRMFETATRTGLRPTWSWISVTGRAESTGPWITDGEHGSVMSTALTVVTVGAHPVDGYPALDLVGSPFLVRPVVKDGKRRPLDINPADPSLWRSLGLQSDSDIGEGSFEADVALEDGEEMEFLPLLSWVWTSDSEKAEIKGLVIKESTVVCGSYERAGIGRFRVRGERYKEAATRWQAWCLGSSSRRKVTLV
ncbi:heterokaryon incompatibility protein-domain-containing protein [Lasiosphaeria hispida]|uniref:Heterokaryon incompatibility protein-domain-containing protein n=1 Tax=Lasiosphaeria hispida TaxID=260671 RepID=A0AAJ0MD89_9PEZI|nr:heterokaryon incompatibility protein-domain-containing protein [Lasiosphaeria hispida]